MRRCFSTPTATSSYFRRAELAPSAITGPWQDLERALAADLHLPGSPGFEARRRGFIARFDDIVPTAIAAPATAEQAAAALSVAALHGLPFAIRSGGHSAAGNSSTRGLLIDLDQLSGIEVEGDVAKVGAGCRTGDMAARLAAKNRLVPVGTCPSVAISGLALGGGFGHFGRAFGFTCDWLVGLEALLADGRLVYCSADSEPDLFWALRGAGPASFALVTRLDFRTVPLARATSLRAIWPIAAAVPLVAAWQRWMQVAPESLTTELSLVVGDIGGARCLVEGVHLGGEQQASVDLADLVREAATPPLMAHCMEYPLGDAISLSAAGAASGDGKRQGYRVMKSQLLDRPLGAPLVQALIVHMLDDHRSGEVRSLELAAWGGAYNRPPPDACAFVHRSSLFSIQHSALVDPDSPGAAKAAARDWVRQSWSRLEGVAGAGTYQNFPDLDLEDAEKAYFGENLERLRAIKGRYDPGNLFRFGQPVTTGEDR